ncbi:glycosyltransferase family 4 protein [Alsobacter sp. R-9]
MASRPCILALVTEAFGGKGGIARYNRDLLAAWAEQADIHILPRSAGEQELLPAGVSQTFPSRGRLGYAIRAAMDTVRVRPSTVFCGHLYMAPLAWALARLTGAKFVLQVHGIDAWTSPGALRRFACEQADWILSVSRYTRSRLLTWAAIEPNRVIVLPNTVDGRYRPGDRGAARARFGFGDGPVVVSVGRLDARERYKGQDAIIASLPDLLKHHPDLVYAIAGEGDDRPRLDSLAASLGVSGAVLFLGAVPDDALADFYRAADLFALPSTGEGFGIVFLEAMACGTPALGLAEAGAVDALAEGRLGETCHGNELALRLNDILLRLPSGEGERQERVSDISAKVRWFFGADSFREQAVSILQGRL